ncbi:hypothetical protein B0H15DRAFT_841327 [Mycena belliarum]|uniref:Uncharacterized protein n=1 Tax=Mycena belliarum TaxID=1033014 RepID=A0AAD6U3E0_9AGAR|nr:hypothetical protein B0H15DRAFT_841327 [Mycena belliae]
MDHALDHVHLNLFLVGRPFRTRRMWPPCRNEPVGLRRRRRVALTRTPALLVFGSASMHVCFLTSKRLLHWAHARIFWKTVLNKRRDTSHGIFDHNPQLSVARVRRSADIEVQYLRPPAPGQIVRYIPQYPEQTYTQSLFGIPGLVSVDLPSSSKFESPWLTDIYPYPAMLVLERC